MSQHKRRDTQRRLVACRYLMGQPLARQDPALHADLASEAAALEARLAGKSGPEFPEPCASFPATQRKLFGIVPPGAGRSRAARRPACRTPRPRGRRTRRARSTRAGPTGDPGGDGEPGLARRHTRAEA